MSSSPEAWPRAAAVVVAGGVGRRVGGAVAKQFLEVRGVPILLRSIRPFLDPSRFDAVVVVVPPADAAEPPAWLRELPVTLVGGGAERSDSVWNGLQAVPQHVEVVLVHDGARPFVPPAVIDRVLNVARRGPAIAALPVSDTVKQVDATGVIVATPDRGRLWLAQTPQGFPLALLVAAHQRARAEGMAATDDAALVERTGARVRVVEGAPENIKVTRGVDLVIAHALAEHLDGR